MDHKICRKDDDEDDEDDELILGNDYEDAVIHKRVKYSDEDKFKCACGRVYQNEEKFHHHLRYGTLKFPCANCTREFTTQRSLDQHSFSDKCKGTASGHDDNNAHDYEPPVTVRNANSSSSSSSRNIQSLATSASVSASSKGG